MKRGIKKKLMVLAATMAMTTAAVAGPASADRFDEDDWRFRGYPGWGYPYYNVIDDVDYENVRERNPRDGDCRVEDVDLDGFIAEYELTCYY